jgi:hypothetical protein
LNECSALLVSADDKNNRLRVREGEEISNDYKIVSITPVGVEAIVNGRRTVLQPVSLSGEITQTANTEPQSPITSILSSNQPAAAPTRTPYIDENFSGSVSSNEQPNLGPTGLF